MPAPSKTTVQRGGFDRRRRHGALPEPPSALSNGAVVERLTRMRTACHALALELAGAKRELRAAQAELRKLERRSGVG
jgi:hypothetical protein